MATITLRLDDAARDGVEAAARDRGTSVSEVLRAAIGQFLGRTTQRLDIGVPPSLDMVQRRILALLHENLAQQAADEDERGYHLTRAKVFNDGFTAEYTAEFDVMGPEVTPDECDLVADILDLFTVLETSVERLGVAERDELGEGAVHALSFSGLDMNNPREARLLSYARHLIDTGRWETLAGHFSPANDRGNSHMPALATYQRMLSAFQPLWKRKTSGRGSGPDALLLNVDELGEVLAARSYPRGSR